MSTSLMPVIITTQQGIYVEIRKLQFTRIEQYRVCETKKWKNQVSTNLGRKLLVARLKSLNIIGWKIFSYIIWNEEISFQYGFSMNQQNFRN